MQNLLHNKSTLSSNLSKNHSISNLFSHNKGHKTLSPKGNSSHNQSQKALISKYQPNKNERQRSTES